MLVISININVSYTHVKIKTGCINRYKIVSTSNESKIPTLLAINIHSNNIYNTSYYHTNALACSIRIFDQRILLALARQHFHRLLTRTALSIHLCSLQPLICSFEQPPIKIIIVSITFFGARSTDVILNCIASYIYITCILVKLF